MELNALWDPASAAIVLGGTLVATILRAGMGDLGTTAAMLANLTGKPFDYGAARAEIAADIEDIRHHGVLRAPPSHSSDPEIADAADALVRHRSLKAAMDEHERYKRLRTTRQQKALRTIHAAADLAPIFGLAGTLLALTQLRASGLDAGDLASAVGMAVLSTLYGLLAAHLVLMPLARWIERRGEREEADRQLVFDWLSKQLSDTCPGEDQSRRHDAQ